MSFFDGYREQMDQMRLDRVLGGVEQPPEPPPPPVPPERCAGCGADIAMRGSARGPAAIDARAMSVRRLATGETRWFCSTPCFEAHKDSR